MNRNIRILNAIFMHILLLSFYLLSMKPIRMRQIKRTHNNHILFLFLSLSSLSIIHSYMNEVIVDNFN